MRAGVSFRVRSLSELHHWRRGRWQPRSRAGRGARAHGRGRAGSCRTTASTTSRDSSPWPLAHVRAAAARQPARGLTQGRRAGADLSQENHRLATIVYEYRARAGERARTPAHAHMRTLAQRTASADTRRSSAGELDAGMELDRPEEDRPEDAAPADSAAGSRPAPAPASRLPTATRSAARRLPSTSACAALQPLTLAGCAQARWRAQAGLRETKRSASARTPSPSTSRAS